MITRLTVENFRALRKVTVDLEPFTVLIGPNDTGKTSFLEALYAVAMSAHKPWNECFWSDWNAHELVYGQNPNVKPEFEASLGSVTYQPSNQDAPVTVENPRYTAALEFLAKRKCKATSSLQIKKGRTFQPVQQETGHDSVLRSKQNDQTIRACQNKLSRPTLARWDCSQLAVPSLPVTKQTEGSLIGPTGNGLPTALAQLKLGDEQQYQKWMQSFRVLFENRFRGIEVDWRPRQVDVPVAVVNQQQVILQKQEHLDYEFFLRTVDNLRIPAANISGGILYAIAFLTLVHETGPQNLLLIEEPENGLHPSRLGDIISMLRQAVEQNPGTQVVLTTHSPLLLNHVRPEEVRVFLRNPKNTNDIDVENLRDVPDIQDRLNFAMLGEIVYNEGEEGLVEEIKSARTGRSTSARDPGDR